MGLDETPNLHFLSKLLAYSASAGPSVSRCFERP